MCIIGLMLFSLEGTFWPFLVAIPEFLIAIPTLKKSPSATVVNENIKKKRALEEEIRELESKM